MARIITGLVVGSLVAGGIAAGVSAQSSNPLIGTWKFNAQKSKLSNTLPPKDLLRKYEDRGEGVYIYTQQGHGPDGSMMYSLYVAKDDGRDYPLFIQGADDFGMISLKKVDNFTSQQTERAVQGGRVTATGTRKISPDGKTMTITIQARATAGGQDDAAGAVANAQAQAAPAGANGGRTGAYAPEAVIALPADIFVFDKVE